MTIFSQHLQYQAGSFKYHEKSAATDALYLQTRSCTVLLCDWTSCISGDYKGTIKTLTKKKILLISNFLIFSLHNNTPSLAKTAELYKLYFCRSSF